MIGMDENVQYSQVQQNFYGASSYDKQLMTLFSLMPFTGKDYRNIFQNIEIFHPVLKPKYLEQITAGDNKYGRKSDRL